MPRWLYDSDGDAIAFIAGDSIFTRRGDFFGRLYEDKTVWNGDYVGELFADDRLIYDGRKLHGRRSIPIPPGLPPTVGEPMFKGPLTLPTGFQDVDIR